MGMEPKGRVSSHPLQPARPLLRPEKRGILEGGTYYTMNRMYTTQRNPIRPRKECARLQGREWGGLVNPFEMFD